MIESIEELQEFLSRESVAGRSVRMTIIDDVQYVRADLLAAWLYDAQHAEHRRRLLDPPVRYHGTTSIFGRPGIFTGIKPQDSIPRLAEPLRDPELEWLRSKGKA